ncbi:MAG: hypothetical protein QNL04_02005 [SAR324 cluster bacterium]|nr:hypothetical protein [SAR324 cluster bacterium]
MKIICLLLSILMVAVPSTIAFAKEKGLSTKACYQEFEKYPPKKVIQMARTLRDHISKKGQKGMAALNKPSAMVWPNPPVSPILSVVHCGEMRVETFALPEMLDTVRKKGFLQKFQDAKGKHTFVELCSQMKGHKSEVWTMQDHYWIGCEGLLKMGVLMVKVPKTPYSIQVSLPNDKYSLKDLTKALKN